MQEQGLGGIMLWSLDLDDPTGKYCNQGPFPLTSTVKAVLEGKRLIDIGRLRSSGVDHQCETSFVVLLWITVFLVLS